MTNPVDTLLSHIKSHTRAEWQALAKERWTELRIWAQENGESACILGFVVGLFFVIGIRFFVALGLFVGLLLGIAWSLAPETRAESPAIKDDEVSGV